MLLNMNSEFCSLENAIRLYEAGKPDEAEAVCRQVILAQLADSYAFQLLGVIAFRRKNYEEAEHAVLRAIAISSQSAEYQNDLGNIYMAQGKLEIAEKCFREAVREPPEKGTHACVRPT